MSGTRAFDFISGIESSSAPAASTPTNPSDVMTLGYADAHYANIAPTIQGSGTYASPQAITNGSALAFSGLALMNVWFITGNAGPVSLGTSQQIAVPARVGQFLFLVGGSDTNSVTLSDGNGLVLNGSCVLQNDKVIGLMSVSATKWIEIFRS